MEEKRRNVSILGPVLLMAVGTVLLLNTLGILEWSVWWTLFRLWPVLLIAAGIDLLLGRRSIWGSLLAAALVLAVLAGALVLAQTDVVRRALPGQEVRQPLGGATQAEVAIEPGVGVLRIEALPESANLVEGRVSLAGGEELAQDYSQQGEQARYSLKATGEVWIPFGGAWDDRRVWELGLSPGAALQLRTALGAGETVLDLTGLAMSDLTSSNGVGRTEITLPAEGQFTARIDQAVGLVEVIVPDGMAVRLQANTALAGRQLPAGLQPSGENVFVSPGYATAENRIDMTVGLPVGLLTVRYSQ